MFETLNRREFTLLMSLGFAQVLTGAPPPETNQPDYLTSQYNKYARRYGITDKKFSFNDKIFEFKKKQYAINTERFCFVNYDYPAAKQRFFIFNKDATVQLSSLASHGINTGNETSCLFSNTDSSYQSSLGIYVTGTPYVGNFGPSINLHGLSYGNNLAFDRRIVIHGADYCSTDHIAKYGFLGRSLGCIALSKKNMISAYQILTPGTIVIAKQDTKKTLTEALIPPTQEEKTENRLP
mgnify:CR=1 FL=1